MNKFLLLFLSFSSLCATAYAQASGERILFIIDSVPLLKDPEVWNPIRGDDIADMQLIRDKDSIKQLGWEEVDGITFIFTKAYRNRPDSIRKLPSHRSLEMRADTWYFGDSPYTGRFINYYNSGRIQNEGTMLNGKLTGALIVYFTNGNKKLVSTYKDGILHGLWSDYYPNGVLMNTRQYRDGRTLSFGAAYFITGQIKDEIKPKGATPYDTAVTYYSTGAVKGMTLIRNGVPVLSKRETDLRYYNTRFYQHMAAGEIREANKCFYQLWLLDSTSADTHFREGLLLSKEGRFEQAIAEFDKALLVEPLMREALVHRGLARIKKYKYADRKSLPKQRGETPLTLDDLTSLPDDEGAKICNDLRAAEAVDFSEQYVLSMVPRALLDYCRRKSNH